LGRRLSRLQLLRFPRLLASLALGCVNLALKALELIGCAHGSSPFREAHRFWPLLRRLKPPWMPEPESAMCTSLLYRDAAGRAYVGRTLELTIDLPYLVACLPEDQELHSAVAGQPPLRWHNRFSVLAVTMPANAPSCGRMCD
jgi:hypothetical protein